MTTPKRKAALQWFYDRGTALKELGQPDAPSAGMMNHMRDDGQLQQTDEGYQLTDKGRQDLHEA